MGVLAGICAKGRSYRDRRNDEASRRLRKDRLESWIERMKLGLADLVRRLTKPDALVALIRSRLTVPPARVRSRARKQGRQRRR